MGLPNLALNHERKSHPKKWFFFYQASGIRGARFHSRVFGGPGNNKSRSKENGTKILLTFFFSSVIIAVLVSFRHSKSIFDTSVCNKLRVARSNFRVISKGFSGRN